MFLIVGQAIDGVIGVPVAVASVALVLLVVLLSLRLGLRIEREILVAAGRAVVQLLAVGVLFAFIFGSDLATVWAWVWVALMTVVAAAVIVRRAGYRIPTLRLVASATVLGSAAIAVGVSFGLGVFDFEPVALVVIAGITIGNAVPSAVLGANQAVGLCRDRSGDIEALLALGFDRTQTARFMAPRAAKSSIIPQVERTKVVGLIALPGAMTGLLLAGVEPVDAVVVQLLVMYIVLATATVCVIGIVAAVTRAAVTDELAVADWVRRSD